MAKDSQNKFRETIDNLLLVNLFTVVFFAIFFVFSVIMKINGVNIFLDFVQKIWNPLIVPLITILIISSLTSKSATVTGSNPFLVFMISFE